MHFDEVEVGDVRIYTGAIEAQDRGYKASVVIKQFQGVPHPIEVYRDLDMGGGHIWHTPHEALQYAMKSAQRFLRYRQPVLGD